jgi:hypothetical protein
MMHAWTRHPWSEEACFLGREHRGLCVWGFAIPHRPDLKEPPNRKWLGLYKVLPPPPEYFPQKAR